MMPQSTLQKKPAATVKQQPAKPKVTEEQSRNIINGLFEQFDNKNPDELEDINNSAALIAELNKPLAFNKEDQLYNKYNVPLANQGEVKPEAVVHGANHTTSNPFSKKRKFDEISGTSSAPKQAAPQSAHTSYFDAQSH